MSAQNEAHQFEGLCFQIARIKICENILPATGPVQAGGDKGIDFDTYTSFLRNNPGISLSGIAQVSDQRIIFACSLQVDYKSKIRSDIKKILKENLMVDRIIFFSGVDIPIGRRRELINWALNKFSIILEIWDANSISIHLTDRHTFWIAEDYLKVPSSSYPPSEEDEWYNSLKEKLRSFNFDFLSYNLFWEIKECTRFCYSDSNTIQDLTYWLSKLETVIDSNIPNEIRKRAFYEYAWARFKGNRGWRGLEEKLIAVFTRIPELKSIDDFNETQNLLGIAIGKSRQSEIDIPLTELLNFRDQLLSKIDNELDLTTNAATKASLLFNRGPLSSFGKDEFSFDEISSFWMQIPILIEKSPLFPLEWMIDILNKMLKRFSIFANQDFIFDLIGKLDSLLAERYGEFAVAQKAKDRAMIFLENDRPLDALKFLHQVKIQWFADETLEGCILTLLLIHNCYMELNLPYCAKYFALFSDFLSDNVPDAKFKRFIPQGILAAAVSDYSSGAWASYLELISLYSRSQRFLGDPTNFEDTEEFENVLFHLMTIGFISEKIESQDLTNYIQERILDSGFNPAIQDIIEEIPNPWISEDFNYLWTKVEEQLNWKPFNDIEESRTYSWNALGVNWITEWLNEFETNVKAEQFISYFQILLTIFHQIDLCLLQTEVKMSISLSEKNEYEINSSPSNQGRFWNVLIPKKRASKTKKPNPDLLRILANITYVLFEISLLKEEEFNQKIRKATIAVKASFLFIGNSYEQIYRSFFDPKAEKPRISLPILKRPFKIKKNPYLNWINGIGPTYDHQDIIRRIQERYEKSITPIRFTLIRLNSSPSFLETIQSLRMSGYLDWQILGVIADLSGSYRINQKYGFPQPHLLKKYIDEFYFRQESSSDPEIPLSEFNKEKLESYIRYSVIKYLPSFDLELHQETPDIDAICHFLGERYNFWEIDIPHDDPFVNNNEIRQNLEEE